MRTDRRRTCTTTRRGHERNERTKHPPRLRLGSNRSAGTSGARRVRGSSIKWERLDCYRVAIEFQTWAARLCTNQPLGSLRDQLDRASVSTVLNIAEGAGRLTAPDKARFFAIARGSASECAGVLELLAARGVLSAVEHRRARGLIVRIVQMLPRLGHPRVTKAHTEERDGCGR